VEDGREGLLAKKGPWPWSRALTPVDPFSAVPAFLRSFVAPAVSPPCQYFRSRINAAISGNTLMSEPSAIKF
jgi:hypothetical protein